MIDEQDAQENQQELLVPYYLTPGTKLPDNVGGEPVSWQSSLHGIMDASGRLTPPQEGWSEEFELTATSLNRMYSYRARMLGTDVQWLAGYTRKPDNNPNVYSRFVAKSLHLSLGNEGIEAFEPLNNNYGILFAKADYSLSAEGETRLLEQPRMFRLTDGAFGILAIPLDHEGKVVRFGELLYFETKDFVHYQEREVLRLTNAPIADFSCERDAATLLYRIGWKEKNGEVKYRTTKDFIHLNPVQFGAIYPSVLISLVDQGVEAAQLIALTSTEARYLLNKLGRVRHIAIEAPRIHIPVGTDSLKQEAYRALAIYSDGSHAQKRIQVDPNEFSALDLTMPGEYRVRASVVRNRFPYPMMNTRPDPYVLLWKGRYYFISTDDDGQKKIYIRSADTLERLGDGQAEETLLWDGNMPDGERLGQHWAPELHVIGERLYCFLAISVNGDWHGVQAHVALLRGENPMILEHWDKPKRVLNKHGEVLVDHYQRERSISLDMTYFEHKNLSYVCWSQPAWLGENQERASLYLATVMSQEPWRLTSDPVRICRNEYGWDRNGGTASGVSEGAFVLHRKDKLFMVFSGSNVGPNYAVGLLEMDASADPMDPESWRKWNYPVMHSNCFPGQYGPGHNMFVQDEYGDWLNVYHACGVEGGFRHAGMRPLHFRFDGSPVLDMYDEEEVAPELEQLTITIVVE